MGSSNIVRLHFFRISLIIHVSVSVAGGIGTLINEIANYQSSLGHKVHLVFCKRSLEIVQKHSMWNNEAIKFWPFEVKSRKGNFYYKGLSREAKKVYDELKIANPNEKIVVHFHNPMAVGVFGKVDFAPCLCTIHSIYTKYKFVLSLYKMIMNKNMKFVAVSNDMQNYYKKIVLVQTLLRYIMELVITRHRQNLYHCIEKATILF